VCIIGSRFRDAIGECDERRELTCSDVGFYSKYVKGKSHVVDLSVNGRSIRCVAIE
jgi:hypothetical protein